MQYLVDSAVFPPGHCAVTGRTEGPFVDTGSDYHGHGRIYVSLLAVQQLATEHLHMVDGGEMAQLKQENEELRAYVADLEGFQDSVEKVFKKLDRKAPKRRPAKAVKAPERIVGQVEPYVEPPSPVGPGPRFGDMPKVKEYGSDAEGAVIERGVAEDRELTADYERAEPIVDPGHVGGEYPSEVPTVDGAIEGGEVTGSADDVRPSSGVKNPRQDEDEIKTIDGEIETDKPDDVKPLSDPDTPDPTAKTTDTRGASKQSAQSGRRKGGK